MITGLVRHQNSDGNIPQTRDAGSSRQQIRSVTEHGSVGISEIASTREGYIDVGDDWLILKGA